MSRNSARLAVAEFIVETMGLIPMGFLCIFLRKYMLAVLTVGGGKQKSLKACGPPVGRPQGGNTSHGAGVSHTGAVGRVIIDIPASVPSCVGDLP